MNCIYCGQPAIGNRKGEHIVPNALGGKETLKKEVCLGCNNNVLSQLDEELACKSPISMVAVQELDKRGDNVWDYNSELDIALEAQLLPNIEASILWPQVVLLDKSPLFFFDMIEAKSSGLEEFCDRFQKNLKFAIESLSSTEKKKHRLLWRRIRRLPLRGSYPVRVFTRHRSNEIVEGVTFECRYAGGIDRSSVLQTLKSWVPNISTPHEDDGVIDPEGGFSYRPRWVLRALVKTGINILAKQYGGSRVNATAFRDAVRFVRFDEGSGPSSDDCGFVVHADVAAMGCSAKCHKFRLSYDRNWSLHCAFFGGRVGATVVFPGPQLGDTRSIVSFPPSDGRGEVVEDGALSPQPTEPDHDRIEEDPQASADLRRAVQA